MRFIYAFLFAFLLVSRAFGLGHSQIYDGASGQATATYSFAITNVRIDGPNFLVDWSFSYADSATGSQGNLSYPYSPSSGFYPYVSIAGGAASRIATLNSETTITGTMTIATTNGYIDLYIKSNAAGSQGFTNAGPERVNLGNCSETIVAITPSTGPVGVVGQTMAFQATRSVGAGQFNYSLNQGSGALAGHPQTGAFTFTPSAPGRYEIKVWTSENYPFCRSADELVYGTSDPQAVNRVTLTFDNAAGTISRTFKVFQDGQLVTTRVIPAGERLIQTITVPNNTPVSVVSSLADVVNTDGIWHPGPGEITEQEVAVVNPTTGPPSTNNPPPSPPIKPVGPDNPKPQSDNTKSVWTSINNTKINNNVTNHTYAEGVDKLGEKIDKTNSLLTEEHKKNDETREAAEETKGGLLDKAAAAAAATDRIAAAQATATQAAGDLQASPAFTDSQGFASAVSVSPSLSSSSVSVSASISGAISQGAVRGTSLELSPGQAGGLLGVDFSPFLTWVKHFIAVMAVLWFLREVVDAVKQACHALAATPQHTLGGTTSIVKGVNVLGNTVGAIPAAAMWAVVIIASTAAIVAAPTLLAASIYAVSNLSGMFGDLSTAVSSVAQAAGGGAGSSVLVKVFQLCNLVCPVGLLVTIAVNRILISMTALVQFVAMQVAVKIIGYI